MAQLMGLFKSAICDHLPYKSCLPHMFRKPCYLFPPKRAYIGSRVCFSKYTVFQFNIVLLWPGLSYGWIDYRPRRNRPPRSSGGSQKKNIPRDFALLVVLLVFDITDDPVTLPCMGAISAVSEAEFGLPLRRVAADKRQANEQVDKWNGG